MPRRDPDKEIRHGSCNRREHGYTFGNGILFVIFRCSNHRDSLQLRISHTHESGHTGGSNRRQLPCISIHRTLWIIDFLLVDPLFAKLLHLTIEGSWPPLE